MSVNIRLKRRAAGGAAGAPAALKTAEPAYNETDEILYIGRGDDGAGNATSVPPIAGRGAFVDKTTNQTIAGVKTFSSGIIVPDEAYGAGWNSSTEVPTKNAVYDKIESVAAAGVADGDKGDVIVSAGGSVYTIDSNVVTNAKAAQMATKTYKGRTSAGTGNSEDVPTAALKADLALVKGDVGLANVDNTADVNKPVSTAQQTVFDSKAPLNSPALTGTPSAPTAAVGTNTTQISTTQFVVAEVLARLASNDALLYKGAIDASTNPNYPAADAGHTYRISVAGRIGGAAGAKVEAGDRITANVDGSAAGTQVAVGANWDILQVNIDGAATIDGVQTFTNKTISGASNTFSNIPSAAIVGLGSMALQNAHAVAITGGSIDGVVIDGGTF